LIGTPTRTTTWLGEPIKLLPGLVLPIGTSDPVAVAADGSFAADVPTPPINARIVALPVESESLSDIEQAFGDAGPFRSTPVLGGGAVSGEIPGLGTLSMAFRGQRQGLGLIGPAGLASIELPFSGSPLPGSLSIGALGGVTTGPLGAAEGDLGLSFMGASAIPNAYNDARGGVTVDGVRGYLRDHIPVGSDELPAPASKRTVDFQTGGQTVVQSQPIYVAANPAEDPDGLPLAGGYRASGLELHRTTVQDHDGRQVSVTDRFVSTDGRAHKIDLLYAEGLTLLAYDARAPFQLCGFVPCDEDGGFESFSGGGFEPFSVSNPFDTGGSFSTLAAPEEPTFPAFEMPAFRIPWETGDKWESRSHAEPMTAPSTATSTVYTRVPHVMRLAANLLPLLTGGETPEGFVAPPITSTYGAITYGTRPDAGLFVSDPLTIGAILGGTSTQFVSRFVRDVPAGGETTIAQVYSTGTTPAEVETLAAAAEQRLAPVAITPPAPPAPPIAPPATPTPPAPPAARKAPRKLSTSSSLKRTKKGQYRFRFTGRLALPSGVGRSACRAGGGTVMVQVKAGRNTISTRRAKLNRNCRYTVRINFRSAKRFGKRTRLTVVTKWSGNRRLAAKPAKRFTIKIR
ncbi:MAG: hypothetical protein ITG02_04235, partial [Patulibacter sp.]|nr:hypothetical protein [Patulibacter sp.]